MPSILRSVLFANAAFSASSGLVLAIAGPTLAGTLGVPSVALVPLGLALIAFAGFVALTAWARWVPGAWATLAADVTWVIGAAIILAGYRSELTVSAVWALAGVTIVVLDLAIVEGIGLRTIRGAAS